jgi:hypothetical protein
MPPNPPANPRANLSRQIHATVYRCLVIAGRLNLDKVSHQPKDQLFSVAHLFQQLYCLVTH